MNTFKRKETRTGSDETLVETSEMENSLKIKSITDGTESRWA